MNFKAAFLIAKKDLSIELRSKHSIGFMFIFSFAALLLFNFASEPYSQSVKEVAPGFLWFILVFTGLLGISRAFVREEEAGTLDALRLCPISASDILFGKVLYNLALMLLIELITLPLFIVLFDYAIASIADVLAVLTLGIAGLVVVGSFVSAVVISARSRELLLQVVVLPLLLPIIIPVMMSLREVMIFAAPLLELPELRLIILYIVIMTTLSSLLFSYVMEE